jgi:hypothetical protein
MSILKQLPFRFTGELHQVQLVNFTVDRAEVEGRLPAGIKPRYFDDRVMISMVNVDLRNMHPSGFPLPGFAYRHIGFRLLVDDAYLNQGTCKGIFFLRSFTDKPLVVLGGSLLTDYNLERAEIYARENEVYFTKDGHFLRYSFTKEKTALVQPGLMERISALDRAYSMLDGKLRMVEIQREKWPLEALCCEDFETTFFATARFEGAFRVTETIFYKWLPPQLITQ